jgi:hypothetical protein
MTDIIHSPTAVQIRSMIHNVRGKAVMLDRDLATLYQVETRTLNQAVKRHSERFPDDFMFSLSRDEIMRISQSVISLKFAKNVNVFTEQGVAMLSSVLRSPVAAQANVGIMRAFVQLRRMTMSIVDLRRRIDSMESKYDEQFRVVFDAIHELLEPPPPPEKNHDIGFVPRKEK